MKEKNNLLPLWIAGGSILFVSAAMPLIDSVVTWIPSAINAHINRMQIDLELDQREAQAAAETIKPSPQMTQAIGFDVNPEPDYEEEYE